MGEQPFVRLPEIDNVVEEFRRADGDDIAIILVGSAARNVRSEESDIDLLLLGTERPKVLKSFPGFHIQASSVAEFMRNLRNGEDFESWCIRLGEALHDGRGHWTRMVTCDEADQWPRWD